MNKHGTTDLVRTERRPYPRKDPEERFWAKVSIPADVLAGCWVWTSAKTTSGYGKFGGGGVGGRTLAAHRVAWTHVNGPIPEGLLICHRCDNPPCVNPAHLFLGTDKDNHDDMKAKGRSPRGAAHGTRTHPEKVRRGEANHYARLTNESVLMVRHLLDEGHLPGEIGEMFGVSGGTIRLIGHGKTWRHVVSGLEHDRPPAQTDE